jgi:phosphatidylserine decarboxylase
MMTVRELIQRLVSQEDLNFLLTNRIPRVALTHFIGWFSQLRHPWLAKASIWVWQQFADLDLSEAKEQRFDSLHDCFIRELKPGSRPVNADPHSMVSPCDGIVGAMGEVKDGQLFQAKGFPYTLHDLLGDRALNSPWQDGVFMTIRITSSMYHRFHAPFDGRLQRVQYFSGDTWNVNPIALKRVEKLFCKNERALLEVEIGEQRYPVALVPVAAVLVASIRLHAIDTLLHTRYQGPQVITCDHSFQKGQELGWFQHGSTILVFAPKGFTFAAGLHDGTQLRMGQALMHLPNNATPAA